MAGFGFTPDDGDDAERKNRENLEAMMRQMQEQIQQQFNAMGINPGAGGFPLAGLSALFGGSQEALPLAPVRDTAKKYISSQGSQPLGTNDLTAVNNACEIADIWLARIDGATGYWSQHCDFKVARRSDCVAG